MTQCNVDLEEVAQIDDEHQPNKVQHCSVGVPSITHESGSNANGDTPIVVALTSYNKWMQRTNQ